MSDQPQTPSPPEPEIVQRAAMLVAGTRYEGKNEHGEIPAMWDEFLPRSVELEDLRVGPEFYGVARARPGPWTGVFEYLAGAPVSSCEGLPEGMVFWEVPAGTYALLPANDVPDIGPAEQYFRGEWLPSHPEYREGKGPFVEIYPARYRVDGIIHLLFSVERR